MTRSRAKQIALAHCKPFVKHSAMYTQFGIDMSRRYQEMVEQVLLGVLQRTLADYPDARVFRVHDTIIVETTSPVPCNHVSVGFNVTRSGVEFISPPQSRPLISPA